MLSVLIAMASDTQKLLTSHLIRLLSSREYPKTICPSEVARALAAAELKSIGASHWRDLMPQVRELLWEMCQQGDVEILQQGEVLSSDGELQDIKGPIRARRVCE